MESKQSTKKRYKKILLIGLFVVLLLVFVCIFKSCSVIDSPEKGQENISLADKDDNIDKEEHVEQHNQTDDEQKDCTEHELIHNNSDQNIMEPNDSNSGGNQSSQNSKPTVDGLGTTPEQSTKPEDPLNNTPDSNTGINDHNDHSSNGPQDDDNQMDSGITPEQPNQPDLPEEDGRGNILKLLYNELIKANKTFEYFLEVTNEIIENY